MRASAKDNKLPIAPSAIPESGLKYVTPENGIRFICPPEKPNANPVTVAKSPVINRIRRTTVAFLVPISCYLSYYLFVIDLRILG